MKNIFHRGDLSSSNKRYDFTRRMPVKAAWRPRLATQLISLFIIMLLGWQFYSWVSGLEAGQTTGAKAPGVEGFLPISAMISLRHWFLSGEFSMVHPAGLTIFSLVLLTGLLLKKSFCSWLCPVGTMSEYLARFSSKIFKRKLKLNRWVDYPLQSLKYLLLLFFGYAIFVTMTANDIATFLASPYNKVADIKMLYFFTNISTTTLVVIGVLTVLSFVLPYFWCRYLCPYGALLGFFSMFSVTKIRRSEPDCINCGKCAVVCPSFLDVDLSKTIHSAECTGCLECVVNCPEEKALWVSTPVPRFRKIRPLVFGILVWVLFYGGIQLARQTDHWRSNVSDEELVDRLQRGLEGPEYDHIGRPASR